MSGGYRDSIGDGWRGVVATAKREPLFALKAARSVAQARWSLRQATSVGPRVRVRGRPYVRNHGTLHVGDRVQIVSTNARTELMVAPGGVLEIGERSLVNYGCSISAYQVIRIGEGCNIGTHVMMMDNEFHSIDPDHRNEVPESRPIELADNVWIGGRSIVMPGVTIGYGSVIGAGSVVTKDVPPRTVAAGVPARNLREI